MCLNITYGGYIVKHIKYHKLLNQKILAGLLGVSVKTASEMGQRGNLKSKPNSNRQALLHI